MGMKKFEETKTMMINTNKKSGFARHMKWALPVSAGFVAGVVPLGFGIYSIAHPKPSLIIIDRLREFDNEIAEEFQQKDGTFLPNYEFIKYITVGEIVGTPLNNRQDPNNPLYIEFKAKYPQYEDVVAPGTFKFHVTRQDGTTYDISEDSSTNGAIWDHGYNYKLFDLFNNDIPSFLDQIAWSHPIPSFNIDLSNAPAIPDWNTYRVNIKDESLVQPLVSNPGFVDRSAIDALLRQEPTPPSRGLAMRQLGLTPLVAPTPPLGDVNFMTFQQFALEIANMHQLATSSIQFPTPVENIVLTFKHDPNDDDKIILEYFNTILWQAASDATISSLPPLPTTSVSIEDAYLGFLAINPDKEIKDYYNLMVTYTEDKQTQDAAIDQKYEELSTQFETDYNNWESQINPLIAQYNIDVAQNLIDTEAYIADQQRIANELQTIRLQNARIEQQFKDDMDEYINVLQPQWIEGLNAESRRVVNAMKIQVEMVRGEGGYVSNFEQDRFFYENLIYDKSTGLFPETIFAQQPRDIDTIYTNEIRNYMDINNDQATYQLIARYISDDILPDSEINPMLTIGQIPYFMGMFSGTTVSFEYEVATTPNGIRLIPEESTGSNRLNTTWLSGDDLIATYDIDKVNNLRNEERGGE